MMRGDTECSYKAQFQQVFIKNEFESSQGASSSLISAESTKLLKDSPSLIRDNVDESATESLSYG